MIVKSTTVRSEFEGVWPIPKCRTCLDRSMFQVQTPRPVFFMLNSTVPRLVELVGFLLKQKPNAKNSPIFHVGVPTLDPTDRGNPRKFPPFHSVEKPIPRTLTMFCAVSEWFQGSSFQKNHGFWPPMSTVSLLYPLHTTLIIREHSYLFNSSSPFYQCLISRNFTIFCWGLTPCSIAKNWMYGSPWKNTPIEINIRIASSQLQTDDHRFLNCFVELHGIPNGLFPHLLMVKKSGVWFLMISLGFPIRCW